jgi:hypothetical protein
MPDTALKPTSVGVGSFTARSAQRIGGCNARQSQTAFRDVRLKTFRPSGPPSHGPARDYLLNLAGEAGIKLNQIKPVTRPHEY